MYVACQGEHEEWSRRRRGGRSRWGVVMLALTFAAACGGERQAESGVAADTAFQAPPADTGPRAPAPDTAAPAQGAQAGPESPAKPEPPTPRTASEPERKPPAATPAPADTQPSQAAQQPAATPAPADTQPAQSAQQPAATDTQSAEAAQPPADTGDGAAAPEVAPLRDEYHQAPRDTVSQVVYEGWKQYNLNCARCHGEDVLGSTIAPHLIVSMKPNGPINTQESFVQVVCAGRPELGMPAWCPLGLEMDKINAIYEYVNGRSAGEIGPGRPAVKQEG